MEELFWSFITFWLNSSLLHLMVFASINARLMLLESRYPGIGDFNTHPNWHVSDFFKCNGRCLVPLLGTWIAVCSLRTWILKSSDLLLEIESRQIFACFRSEVTYDYMVLNREKEGIEECVS